MTPLKHALYYPIFTITALSVVSINDKIYAAPLPSALSNKISMGMYFNLK